MFGKLEATAKINTSGIGLGLSICQKIIQALDGYIYLAENNKLLDRSMRRNSSVIY